MTDKEACNKAIEILARTKDGNDLSPSHLYLLQEAVNSNLTDAGIEEFEKLYESVKSGYKRPWFFGIENLTKDHGGYVYWRGVHVEHYSFSNYEEEKEAAMDLAERCKAIEARGEEVNIDSVVWNWKEE